MLSRRILLETHILPKHADFAKRRGLITLETGGREGVVRMLSVSPSDIHYLPGLECHHQTLPSDRLTVEKIIGSKASLQVLLCSNVTF